MTTYDVTAVCEKSSIENHRQTTGSRPTARAARVLWASRGPFSRSHVSWNASRMLVNGLVDAGFRGAPVPAGAPAEANRLATTRHAPVPTTISTTLVPAKCTTFPGAARDSVM